MTTAKVGGKKYNELAVTPNLKLPYSSKIQCKMEAGVLYIFIAYPENNMQEDSSDFESIAVSVWSIRPEVMVELRFRSLGVWQEIGDLPKYRDARNSLRVRQEWLHYMRFLYRVMRFGERYRDRFRVANCNCSEVGQFQKQYNDGLKRKKLFITVPENESKVKDCDKKMNKAGMPNITENHLEKWFVYAVRNEQEKLPVQFRNLNLKSIHDQLPCSLFYGNVSASSRIFNAGYFDLWGINEDDELYLFELKKKGNVKLGIISELFFYAMVMRDMKQAALLGDPQENIRGIVDFIRKGKQEVVNAYFLVPELHPFLENTEVKEKFLDVLNRDCSNSGIRFGLIEFDQKKIVEDEKTFLERIRLCKQS